MAGFAPAAVVCSSSRCSVVYSASSRSSVVGVTVGRGGDSGKFFLMTQPSSSNKIVHPKKNNTQQKRRGQERQRGDRCAPLGSLALGESGGQGRRRVRRAEEAYSSSPPPVDPKSVVQRDLEAAAEKSYSDRIAMEEELARKKKESQRLQRELALKARGGGTPASIHTTF